MAFFILTRFVLVKYSRAFVERPSQGTSSLASRLTTVSLDYEQVSSISDFWQATQHASERASAVYSTITVAA